MKRCASVLLSYICSSNVLSILLHPALCPRKLNCMDRLPPTPAPPGCWLAGSHGGVL